MTRRISQARLLAHGKYPPSVITGFAHAQQFLPKMAISTYVKLYVKGKPEIASDDYCRRVEDVSEKLDVHKRVLQCITVDTLAKCLDGKTRSQCNAFMRDPDSIHALISAKTLNHPLCPNTMDFYSGALGKADPVQFHGQLINGIVASISDGWDTYSKRDWSFLKADKFKKFFSKRVQEFTNLHESVEVENNFQEPDLEPISSPAIRARPNAVAINEQSDDFYSSEDSVGEEYSSYDDDDEDIGEEYSSDGIVEVESVLADSSQSNLVPYAAPSIDSHTPHTRKFRPSAAGGPRRQAHRKPMPSSSSDEDTDDEEEIESELVGAHSSNPVLSHVAKQKPERYHPDLVPVEQLQQESSARSKLVVIEEKERPAVRSNLVPISSSPSAVRSKLVPIETEKPAVSPKPPVVGPDRLGGESLAPTRVRRTNLVPIGAEVQQKRRSTLEPYKAPVQPNVRAQIVPITKPAAKPIRQTRARPGLMPDKRAAPIKTKKQMPEMLVEEAEDKFENVKLSMRWLETYLGTHGAGLSEELVFFAPTNAVSQAIQDRADSKKRKHPAIKPIVEAHLCEHSGAVDNATLQTVSGGKVVMGRRGRIQVPQVKSEWADFVDTQDVAGFNVHVYAHRNAFVHPH